MKVTLITAIASNGIIGKEGKMRIALEEKRPSREIGAGVREAPHAGSEYVVTAILRRCDGSKSGAVINGVFVEEGAILPFAPLGARPRLAKITSDRFVVLLAGKKFVRIPITCEKGTKGK